MSGTLTAHAVRRLLFDAAHLLAAGEVPASLQTPPQVLDAAFDLGAYNQESMALLARLEKSGHFDRASRAFWRTLANAASLLGADDHASFCHSHA
jgi:hypothetical protein